MKTLFFFTFCILFSLNSIAKYSDKKDCIEMHVQEGSESYDKKGNYY